MKTCMSIIILLVLNSFTIAQDVKTINKTIEIVDEDKILLELEGDITVKRSMGNDIELITNFIQKGKVIGYSNKKKRKEEFDIVVERKENSVVISPGKMEAFGMLGISWYREEIEHLIYIPENIDVSIVKEEGDITILNVHFKSLWINNEKGNTVLIMNEEKIRTLTAATNKGKIYVSDEPVKDFAYNFIGDGDCVVSVISNKGKIKLNLKTEFRSRHQ